MRNIPDGEKKGITILINAELHAEVSQYVKDHGMTMAEFVTFALDNELHPKYNQKEGQNMEKMRTLAFQVPEDLFQKIKEYLQRNRMSQKEFVIGLIEREIERDMTEREAHSEALEDAGGQVEKHPQSRVKTPLWATVRPCPTRKSKKMLGNRRTKKKPRTKTWARHADVRR